MSAPLLFLIFNRPDLTTQVFSRIREYQPSKLYIAADGPRSFIEGEKTQCELSRLATENIDWPCEVNRLYRPTNIGCKIAVSSAITWFFDQESAGIIIEDDCLPDLSFFRFAEELLVRYENDPRVFTISACNFQYGRKRSEDSYYFSRYPHIWGWASWRRVWQQYEVELQKWPDSRGAVAKNVIKKSTRDQLSRQFDMIKAGKINTWDFQLTHAALSSRGLTIIPQQNLINNIGFDARATHTTEGISPTHAAKISEMCFPIKHPAQIIANDEADQFTEDLWFGGNAPLHKRICKKFENIFSKIIRLRN
jgi:hypothetical protein